MYPVELQCEVDYHDEECADEENARSALALRCDLVDIYHGLDEVESKRCIESELVVKKVYGKGNEHRKEEEYDGIIVIP